VSDASLRHAVVIGGTGMLAGVVRDLARRAGTLTLLARSPQRLAAESKARALPMDWADRTSVSNALAHLRGQPAPGLMVSWIHPEGLWCLRLFEELLAPGARSLRVHGSAAGDPGYGIRTDPAPPAHVSREDVVLGWVNEPGGRRWLTHEEICTGVLQALDDPQRRPRIVGVLS
jgi:NAD(P)-dependent dehydrogenase (short-subunit alcohol dehydrogenase family)